MKKLGFGLSIILSMQFAHSQTVGIGTNAPLPSAQLEIKSNNKGVLLPRLDTTQINKIIQPDSGLVIYCKTFKQLAIWNGTYWMLGDGTSMNPVKVGDHFGGGTVYYVDATRRHGLIVFEAAFEYFMCQISGIIHEQTISTDLKTYFHSSIGGGRINTATIVAFDAPDPYYQTIKNLYGAEIEGYVDWYIPSRVELDLLIKASLDGTYLPVLSETSGRIWSSEPATIPGNNGTPGTFTTYWIRCVSVGAGNCGGSNAWTTAARNTGGIGTVIIRQF